MAARCIQCRVSLPRLREDFCTDGTSVRAGEPQDAAIGSATMMRLVDTGRPPVRETSISVAGMITLEIDAGERAQRILSRNEFPAFSIGGIALRFRNVGTE